MQVNGSVRPKKKVEPKNSRRAENKGGNELERGAESETPKTPQQEEPI